MTLYQTGWSNNSGNFGKIYLQNSIYFINKFIAVVQVYLLIPVPCNSEGRKKISTIMVVGIVQEGPRLEVGCGSVGSLCTWHIRKQESPFLARTGRKDAKNGRRKRWNGARSFYLIENRPGSLRVDLEILGFHVTDPLVKCLLTSHSVGSFATRSLRRSKTAKWDEAREEAGPRPRTILFSLSPRK